MISKCEITEIFYLCDEFSKEFDLSGTRNLKHFYQFYVCKHLGGNFPKSVSYNRFVELQY